MAGVNKIHIKHICDNGILALQKILSHSKFIPSCNSHQWATALGMAIHFDLAPMLTVLQWSLLMTLINFYKRLTKTQMYF